LRPKFRAHVPSRFHMLFLVLCVLTVGATALRALSLFLFFDADIGYFHQGDDTVLKLYIMEGICLALCFATPFLLKTEKVPQKEDKLSPVGMIGTVLCALAFVAAALFLLFRYDLVPAPTALVLLAVAFSLLAAVYFALRLTPPSETAVWFGYCAILAAATLLAITYFDRYTPMNAPHKISLHVCMLCTMLALLLEQRALLDRALPRVRVGVTYFAFFLCTAVGVSNVSAFLGGILDSHLYFFVDLTVLALAVYFGAQSVKLTFHAPKESEVEA